jgi:AcrR family transcriptional regulator
VTTTSPDGRQQSDVRRDQMLVAAAELIAERGFERTRIADVAKRIETSPALVMYYFATKDELLTAALRHSEASFYKAAEELLQQPGTIAKRLAKLVDMTFDAKTKEEFAGAWGLWFELWCQAFKHPQVAKDRREIDQQWRDLITRVVQAGIDAGELGDTDVEQFAVEWAALLDGLSVQVALDDPSVDVKRAKRIAMDFARRALELD